MASRDKGTRSYNVAGKRLRLMEVFRYSYEASDLGLSARTNRTSRFANDDIRG